MRRREDQRATARTREKKKRSSSIDGGKVKLFDFGILGFLLVGVGNRDGNFVVVEGWLMM